MRSSSSHHGASILLCLSVYLSSCLLVFLSVCLCHVCLAFVVCLSICLSVCQFFLSVCLSIFLSVCLSFFAQLGLFSSLSVCFVCLSFCPTVFVCVSFFWHSVSLSLALLRWHTWYSSIEIKIFESSQVNWRRKAFFLWHGFGLFLRQRSTMVQNRKKHHPIIHCPTSSGVSEVSERANERVSAAERVALY